MGKRNYVHDRLFRLLIRVSCIVAVSADYQNLICQRIRHIFNNCITFRCYFDRRASISFLISSCITKSTGYRVCTSHSPGKIKNQMSCFNWIICSEFDKGDIYICVNEQSHR